MNSFHTPVLLKEIIENLKVKKGNRYIDATIGGGGHTERILELGGLVLGIDVDQDAIDYLTEKVKSQSPIQSGTKVKIWEQLTLVRGNFRDIDKIAHSKGFEKVSGIIFDLGVSGHQLETPNRGFSFQKMGPLDMRMDQDLNVKAEDLIQVLKKGELYELFNKLGEEGRAFELSRRIVRARRVKPIKTTQDLVEVLQVKTLARIFQALRIAVNDELNSIKETLPKAIELLTGGGRVLVISFHSLEDRIVKNLFLKFSSKGKGVVITKKPIVPSFSEIERNRRSRSAKLRVFEKL